MTTGHVTYVSKNADYCFLRADGKDIFLHCRDIEGRVIPPVDSVIEFTVITRDGKTKAVNAKIDVEVIN
jgi:cold shock CspA family protein